MEVYKGVMTGFFKLVVEVKGREGHMGRPEPAHAWATGQAATKGGQVPRLWARTEGWGVGCGPPTAICNRTCKAKLERAKSPLGLLEPTAHPGAFFTPLLDQPLPLALGYGTQGPCPPTCVNLSLFLGSRLRCTSDMSLSRQVARCAWRSAGCVATIWACEEA